jgi:D-serine deaminase-like pyridoxal phosphate-dependent protein
VARDLARLETPALVLDGAILEANVHRMRARVERLGVRFRPHVKTHKCLEIARLAAGGASETSPITVSTLREADFFAAAGFTDVLYAVGLAPNKLDHVVALLRRGVDLKVLIDNLATARLLVAHARAAGVPIPVLIEIDCDGHRAGVRAGDPLLLELAAELARGQVELRGVLTHAGASYDCKGTEEIRAAAAAERDSVVQAAESLRAAGHPVSIVSVGSTPTAIFAPDLTGVTELRAGVFPFFDLVMHGLGVCRLEELALSVLTSVIGHQPEKGWALVDAGWMALSRDRGTSTQQVDQGYGRVCDLAGRPLHDWVVSATNQEHGIVTSRAGAPLSPESLPVGTLLRILPNHACATAAQHDRYHVVRGATAIEEVWPRFRGW